MRNMRASWLIERKEKFGDVIHKVLTYVTLLLTFPSFLALVPFSCRDEQQILPSSINRSALSKLHIIVRTKAALFSHRRISKRCSFTIYNWNFAISAVLSTILEPDNNYITTSRSHANISNCQHLNIFHKFVYIWYYFIFNFPWC